jgi:hypothetical protein
MTAEAVQSSLFLAFLMDSAVSFHAGDNPCKQVHDQSSNAIHRDKLLQNVPGPRYLGSVTHHQGIYKTSSAINQRLIIAVFHFCITCKAIGKTLFGCMNLRLQLTFVLSIAHAVLQQPIPEPSVLFKRLWPEPQS